MSKPIEILDLSVRAFNSLKRAGFYSLESVYELLADYRKSEIVEMVRNFGESSYDELREALSNYEMLKSINGGKDSAYEIRYYHRNDCDYENEVHSSAIVSQDSFYLILNLISDFVPCMLDIDFDIYDNRTFVLRTTIIN